MKSGLSFRVVIILSLFAAVAGVRATDGTFMAAGGNWNVNGNWWSNNAFPNGIDDVARLPGYGNNTTITLGQDITLGTLYIGDLDNGWIRLTGNTLIFDVSSGWAQMIKTIGGVDTNASAVTLNDTLNIVNTDDSDLVMLGAIGGTGGLVLDGGTTNRGHIRLSGNNTFSGGTLIRNNTRATPGNTNGFGVGTVTVDVSNGQVYLATAGRYTNDFVIAGRGWLENAGQLGAIRLESNARVVGGVTLSGDARIGTWATATGYIDGNIGGAHELEKWGQAGQNSTLVLLGNNSYGDTRVSVGTLQIGTNTAAGTLGSGLVTISNAATLTFNRNDAATWNNTMQGEGFLRKIGTGTLRFGSSDQLASTLRLDVDNGILDLNGTSNTVRFLQGDAAGRITNTAGSTATLALNLTNSAGQTYNGSIGGDTRLVLLKSNTINTDFQVLNGTNTFTGGLVIDGGHLRATNDYSLGAVPAVFDPSNIVMRNGGAIMQNNSDINMHANRGVYLDDGRQIFHTGWGKTHTVNGQISGPGGIEKRDSGILVLKTNNTYSGGTFIVGGGAVRAEHDNALGTGPVSNAGPLQVGGVLPHITITNLISGIGEIRHVGTNTVRLRQVDMSAAGANAGRLVIGNNAAGPGVLVVSNGDSVVVRYLDMGQATGHSGILNQYGGLLNVFGPSDQNGNAEGPFRVGHYPTETSTYNLMGGEFYVTNATGEMNLGIDGNGVWNISGGLAMVRQLNVNTRNNAAGGTLNLSNGVLRVGPGGIVADNAANAVNFAGGRLGAYADYTMSVSGQLQNTTGGFTIDTEGRNLLVSGVLHGAGGFVKDGAGTLTLTASNSYAGDAVVSNGTLLVHGRYAGAGDTRVYAGGTLGGTGNVYNLTALAGGQVSPGASRGTLLVSNDLSLTDARLLYETEPTGAASDLIDVLGGLTASGTNWVTLVPASGGFAGAYTVIRYAGTLTGGAANFDVANEGEYRQTFTIDDSVPGQIDLQVSGAAGNLTWNGAGGGLGTWDITNSAHWVGAEKFYQADGVAFDDTSTNFNVTLSGAVMPSTLTVDTTNIYTFTGAGKVSGGVQLVKNGSGTLVVETDNDNAGGVLVSGGALQVGSGGTAGSLGTLPVTNDALLVYNLGNTVTTRHAVAGSGAFVQSGTGTLHLGVASTHTGGTFASNGVIRVGVNGALGPTGGAVGVAPGAQVNLNGVAQNPNQYRYSIAGSGPDGLGAIINTGASVAANSAVTWLNLDGNATVGAYGPGTNSEVGRLDIANGGGIAGNGYTLTKIGVAPISFRGPTTNLTLVVDEGAAYGENVDNPLGQLTIVNPNGRAGLYGGRTNYNPVILNGGGLFAAGGAVSLWAGPITVSNNSYITSDPQFRVGTNLVINSAISGPGGLSRYGSNLVVIAGTENNTFAGDFNALVGVTRLQKNGATAIPGDLNITNTVSGASSLVELLAPDQIADTATVRFARATNANQWAYLKLLGNSDTVGRILNTDGFGVIENTEGEHTTGSYATGVLGVSGDDDSFFNGYIRDVNTGAASGTTGRLGLAKSGAGTLLLTGNEIRYSGPTDVSGGTLTLSNTVNIFTSTITNNATVNFISTGDWQVRSKVTGDGTLNFYAPTTLTAGIRFNLAGNGVEMGSNGQINILSGRVYFDSRIANWTNNLANLYIAPGAVFDIRADSAAVGALTGSGTVSNSFLNLNQATRNILYVGANGASGTFEGEIAGIARHADNQANAVVNLVKRGGGTQILTGPNSTWGWIAIENGTLQIGDGGANGLIGRWGAITNNGTLAFNRSGELVVHREITGAGTITNVGPGTVMLEGRNTLASDLHVEAGTAYGLRHENAAGTGAIRLNGGTLEISGAGLVEGRYTGAWNPLGANPGTWANLTNEMCNATVVPAGGNGGTWAYSGFINVTNPLGATWTFAENYDDNAYLAIDGVAVLSNLVWSLPTVGTVTLAPGLHSVEMRVLDGTGDVGPKNGWTVGLGYDPLGRHNPDPSFFVPLGDAGDGALLAHNMTITNDVALTADSTLDLANAVGTNRFTGAWTAGASKLTVDGGADRRATIAGPVTLNGSASFDLDGPSIELAGGTTGSGSLTKLGAGTLELSGAAAHTGFTLVSNGLFKVTSTGSIGSSSNIHVAAGAVFDVTEVSGGFSLQGGQTLSGFGTVTGGLALSSGATLAPGASPGLITIGGALDAQAASAINFELASTNSYDRVIGITDLTLAGTVNVTLIDGFNPAAGAVFDLFDWSGTFTDNGYTLNTPALTGSLSWDATNFETDGTLTVIPEPATLGLVGLVGAMLLLGRRRRGRC